LVLGGGVEQDVVVWNEELWGEKAAAEEDACSDEAEDEWGRGMPPSVGLFALRFPVKEDDEPVEGSIRCCDEAALCQCGPSTMDAEVETRSARLDPG